MKLTRKTRTKAALFIIGLLLIVVAIPHIFADYKNIDNLSLCKESNFIVGNLDTSCFNELDNSEKSQAVSIAELDTDQKLTIEITSPLLENVSRYEL